MGSHEGLWKGEGQGANNGELGSAVERGQRKHAAGQEPAEAQAALPGGGQPLTEWELGLAEEGAV